MLLVIPLCPSNAAGFKINSFFAHFNGLHIKKDCDLEKVVFVNSRLTMHANTIMSLKESWNMICMWALNYLRWRLILSQFYEVFHNLVHLKNYTCYTVKLGYNERIFLLIILSPKITLLWLTMARTKKWQVPSSSLLPSKSTSPIFSVFYVLGHHRLLSFRLKFIISIIFDRGTEFCNHCFHFLPFVTVQVQTCILWDRFLI